MHRDSAMVNDEWLVSDSGGDEYDPESKRRGMMMVKAKKEVDADIDLGCGKRKFGS